MNQEKLEKIVKYLRKVGLSEEQINKQLSNKALVDNYLSQISAYDRAIQEDDSYAVASASGIDEKQDEERVRKTR